jgi:BirA family biotin operon repressor/biotin-[acetyl-CoA-carboxylase] ligase
VSAHTDSLLARLKTLLGPWAARFDADLLETCASTNSELLTRAAAGAASGTVLWTLEQTAGRGRRGRAWVSNGLMFSLLWRFESPAALSGLSLAAGLAVARALDGLGVPGVELKWPNDVWLGGRKLSGCLVEMSQSGPRTAAVIGIGLNLKTPVSDTVRDQAATGLDAALPNPPEMARVLAELLKQLGEVLSEFATQGFTPFQAGWNARNALRGAAVRVIDGVSETQGVCLGVDAQGALLLESERRVVSIVGGDVSLRSLRA